MRGSARDWTRAEHTKQTLVGCCDGNDGRCCVPIDHQHRYEIKGCVAIRERPQLAALIFSDGELRTIDADILPHTFKSHVPESDGHRHLGGVQGEEVLEAGSGDQGEYEFPSRVGDGSHVIHFLRTGRSGRG